MGDSVAISKAVDKGNDKSIGEETVLEAFSHQVGGRSLILTYDRNTVCKPLNSQELRFYLDLPESLRPFTPHYKGIVKLAVHLNDFGKITLTSKRSPETCNGTKRKLEDNDEEPETDQHSPISRETTFNSQGCVNPWTFHCQNLLYDNLKKSVNNNKPIDFILMEDLVHNYSTPCIMDLKMGNTMHDSYSDEQKYEKQKAKVSKSTSKTLGLRIAGTQVYNQKLKKYLYQNKYFGFELNDQTFKEELSKFVHNGNQLRKLVVISFLEKLKKLYKCLQEEDKLRFFSSSLLLIYEGKQNDSQCSDRKEEMASVKMIDFARSFNYTKDLAVGADESYLLGLGNLITMFEQILLENERLTK